MGVVITLAILALIGWRLSLMWWPLKRCPSCSGGRRIHGHGTVRRVCGRCRGAGEVRRFGARKAE